MEPNLKSKPNLNLDILINPFRWNEAQKNKNIPDCIGVYVVYDKVTHQVMYVGSGAVKGRTSAWFNKQWPYYVKWKATRRLGEHLMLEFRLIHRLQPPLNKKGIYLERKPLALRLSKAQVEKIKSDLKVRAPRMLTEKQESIRAHRREMEWFEQWKRNGGREQ